MVLTDLFRDRQLREVRDVPGPLDGAEQESGSQLADAVDAQDGRPAAGRLHLGLAVGGAVAAVGVRLSPDQLGYELRRLAVVVFGPDVTGHGGPGTSRCGVGTDPLVGRRDSAPLDCCRKTH